MTLLEKIQGFLGKKQYNTYSLSRYFPKGTAYFYGFPSGEDSHFFNAVPPWVEELVAARTNVCAGPSVKAVNFSSTSKTQGLLQEMGTPILPANARFVIDETITANVKGSERNRKIKQSLESLVPPGTFVMAQPLLGEDFNHLYQFDPQKTIHLNDKMNRPDYIPAQYLPETYCKFENGKKFAEYVWEVPFPSVVKVCSSSAGDGVRICYSEKDVETAKQDFLHVESTIFLEQFIVPKHNLCIQFGIPADPNQGIDIIGHNEQLIGSNGQFLGGVVDTTHFIPEVKEIYQVLQDIILPKVREMGWYGVGGLDVLITEDGAYYFIDSNFRMTATFAFVCLTKNKMITKPVLSFIGSFTGTEADFRKAILPIATMGSKNQRLMILGLSESEGTFRFHGGMFFDEPKQIKEKAKALLEIGIGSTTLQGLM